ncbi:hypothetical protein Ddc_10469 [Ditylenchus destructor]|nr:hypothetical protein Ddc_10469 [Ditylenchus destructor]
MHSLFMDSGALMRRRPAKDTSGPIPWTFLGSALPPTRPVLGLPLPNIPLYSNCAVHGHRDLSGSGGARYSWDGTTDQKPFFP